VVDSRLARDGSAVRRRRECPQCGRRFTTYEQVDEQMAMVVKRDGRREPFARTKALEAVRRACVKRPVADEQLQALVERVAQRILGEGQPEVASRRIGALVMAELGRLDPVSFVRFVSVYEEFDDVDDFVRIVGTLGTERQPDGSEARPACGDPSARLATVDVPVGAADDA